MQVKKPLIPSIKLRAKELGFMFTLRRDSPGIFMYTAAQVHIQG